MKTTKREQNGIIINFVLFVSLFIIVLFFAYTYIYPTVLKIEEEKSEVLKISTDLQEKRIKGISYTDFQDTHANIVVDDDEVSTGYIKGIIKDINEEFYNKHFINESEPDFIAFITKLNGKFQFGTDTQKKQLSKLNFVLPSYVNDIADIDLGNVDTSEEGIHFLTDFRFINYIETILNQFNLSYSNAIGINDVTLVESYAVTETGNTLDKNIYYIPVELDITGEKKYILLFLYYLEYVGNIFIDEDRLRIISPKMVEKAYQKIQNKSEDKNEPKDKGEVTESEGVENEIIIDKDADMLPSDFIMSDYKERLASYNNLIFRGLKYRKINDYKEKKLTEKYEYNILNNQVIDIESISFSKYIDSNPSYGALKREQGQGVDELLKNITPQLDDEFSFKIKLRFYIKGLPKHKIEKVIEDTIYFYGDLFDRVTTVMGKAGLGESSKSEMSKINDTLKGLEAKIGVIKSTAKDKGGSLTQKYNDAYEIKKVLNNIEDTFIQHLPDEMKKLEIDNTVEEYKNLVASMKELSQSLNDPESSEAVGKIYKDIEGMFIGKEEIKKTLEAWDTLTKENKGSLYKDFYKGKQKLNLLKNKIKKIENDLNK